MATHAEAEGLAVGKTRQLGRLPLLAACAAPSDEAGSAAGVGCGWRRVGGAARCTQPVCRRAAAVRAGKQACRASNGATATAHSLASRPRAPAQPAGLRGLRRVQCVLCCRTAAASAAMRRPRPSLRAACSSFGHPLAHTLLPAADGAPAAALQLLAPQGGDAGVGHKRCCCSVLAAALEAATAAQGNFSSARRSARSPAALARACLLPSLRPRRSRAPL